MGMKLIFVSLENLYLICLNIGVYFVGVMEFVRLFLMLIFFFIIVVWRRVLDLFKFFFVKVNNFMMLVWDVFK